MNDQQDRFPRPLIDHRTAQNLQLNSPGALTHPGQITIDQIHRAGSRSPHAPGAEDTRCLRAD